jgi:hypothetical protein
MTTKKYKKIKQYTRKKKAKTKRRYSKINKKLKRHTLRRKIRGGAKWLPFLTNLKKFSKDKHTEWDDISKRQEPHQEQVRFLKEWLRYIAAIRKQAAHVSKMPPDVFERRGKYGMMYPLPFKGDHRHRVWHDNEWHIMPSSTTLETAAETEARGEIIKEALNILNIDRKYILKYSAGKKAEGELKDNLELVKEDRAKNKAEQLFRTQLTLDQKFDIEEDVRETAATAGQALIRNVLYPKMSGTRTRSLAWRPPSPSVKWQMMDSNELFDVDG